MKITREVEVPLGSNVTISLLSGHSEIGGTKLYIEQDEFGILVDFGLNFSRYGHFFEEFNKPRSCYGIHDWWKLGILPPIQGLYRTDLHPVQTPLNGEFLPIEAIFISHAHQDHYLGVGSVREDMPLHMSAITAAILKSTQSMGQTDFMGEAAFAVQKILSKSDPRALCSTSTTWPAIARPLEIAHGNVSDEFAILWNAKKNTSSRARRVTPAHINANGEGVGPLRYEAWPVDHSIPGCLGFIFHTTAGPIAYTGDLRRHGRFGFLSDKFVERLKEVKPRALVVEHTRVGRAPGPNVTEVDVHERALEIVKSASGNPVIADFGARHVERLMTFLEVAEETNRQLVISPKDAHLLDCLATADPLWNLMGHQRLLIYDEVKASAAIAEQEIKAKYFKKLIDAQRVRNQLADLILAFSFWDLGELLSLDPMGLHYIYSSSEPHGEAAKVDLWRLTNWVKFCGGTIHGFTWAGNGEYGHPVFDEDGLNASGHISEEDLIWLLKEVQPQLVIPCHGEHPTWFCEVLKDEPIEVVLAR